MKKKLLILSLIAVFVLSMAACGGGGDKAEKTELSVIDGEWYGLDVFQLDSTAGAQA